MRSVARLTALSLALALLLVGCWDGRELEKRAMVLVLAIDKAQAGVRVGLQLARPQAFASTHGGVSDKEVVTVVSREGPDVPSVLHDLQLAVDRDLFFGHVRVVVVSEEAAREGIWRHLHPLFGDHLVPRTAWLFVVRGKAKEVLALRPALDPNPSTYLTNFFDNRLLMRRPYDVTVGGFHQRWVTPGVEPVAIWIAPGQPDQSAPALLGLAAFAGDRFVGGLEEVAAKGWVITQGQPSPGRLPVTCPGRPGRFGVRINDATTRVRPRLEGGRVKGMRLVTRMNGVIDGLDCKVSFDDAAEIRRFEQALEERVEELIRTGLERSQVGLKSDTLGFGRAVYRHAVKAWPGEPQWQERFPTLPVTVEVNARLDYTRSYLRSKR